MVCLTWLSVVGYNRVSDRPQWYSHIPWDMEHDDGIGVNINIPRCGMSEVAEKFGGGTTVRAS